MCLIRCPFRFLNLGDKILVKIVPEVKERQSRPVEELYKIGWQDAMHYKVEEVHRTILYVVYNILGIYGHVRKELIGI